MSRLIVTLLSLFFAQGVFAQIGYLYLEVDKNLPVSISLNDDEVTNDNKGYIIIHEVPSGENKLEFKFTNPGFEKHTFFITQYNELSQGYKLKREANNEFVLVDLVNNRTIANNQKTATAIAANTNSRINTNQSEEPTVKIDNTTNNNIKTINTDQPTHDVEFKNTGLGVIEVITADTNTSITKVNNSRNNRNKIREANKNITVKTKPIERTVDKSTTVKTKSTNTVKRTNTDSIKAKKSYAMYQQQKNVARNVVNKDKNYRKINRAKRKAEKALKKNQEDANKSSKFDKSNLTEEEKENIKKNAARKEKIVQQEALARKLEKKERRIEEEKRRQYELAKQRSLEQENKVEKETQNNTAKKVKKNNETTALLKKEKEEQLTKNRLALEKAAQEKAMQAKKEAERKAQLKADKIEKEKLLAEQNDALKKELAEKKQKEVEKLKSATDEAASKKEKIALKEKRKKEKRLLKIQKAEQAKVAEAQKRKEAEIKEQKENTLKELKAKQLKEEQITAQMKKNKQAKAIAKKTKIDEIKRQEEEAKKIASSKVKKKKRNRNSRGDIDDYIASMKKEIINPEPSTKKAERNYDILNDTPALNASDYISTRCPSIITDENAAEARTQLLEQFDDEARINFAKKNLNKGCYTTDHVNLMLESFETQTGKYKMVELLFPNIADQDNMDRLFKSFKFKSYRKQISELNN